jgi:RES domain-containing protein
MIYPPEMLDILQNAVVSAWEGTVYRHVFGDNEPVRANTAGARWNAPPVAAIYTSCERATALAEAEYYISLQPLRPKAKRVLYTLRVSLASVVDLTRAGALDSVGITHSVLCADDHGPCRTIGSAVNWLGHGGLLVPSARKPAGTNLVIFQQDLAKTHFEVIESVVIADDERR